MGGSVNLPLPAPGRERVSVTHTSVTKGTTEGCVLSIDADGGGVVLKVPPLFPLPEITWDDEPFRPVRPGATQVFGLSLFKDLGHCHDWIEYAIRKFEELRKLAIDADMQRMEALKRGIDLVREYAVAVEDVRKQVTEAAQAERETLLISIEKRREVQDTLTDGMLEFRRRID